MRLEKMLAHMPAQPQRRDNQKQGDVGTGNRFGPGVTVQDKFMQALRVVETIKRYYPEARQSVKNAEGMVLPAMAVK